MFLSGAETEAYFKKLESLLKLPRADSQLFQAIVNAPFHNRPNTTLMGLGIVVLLLVDKQQNLIRRIALSETEPAKGAVDYSVKPFKEIVIPVDFKGNFIAEAIRSGRYQQTSDWQYLFAPDLSPEEARLNQSGAGVGCSFVYPLNQARDGGALIFSYFIMLDRINTKHRDFMYRYAKLVSAVLEKK
ncbi:hypothetical protein H0X09_02430 [Candidatus Saccharibacteria bacterium]|nr:hypothetical protein [Candidatus Saccharibacteria bacterium]